MSPTAAPLVSVVTPLHNSAACIDTTLESLQAQTFTDWESILVDDGSTDDTPRQVQRYAEDERFTYIRQPNKGIAEARNAGIRAARGVWVALLDHDDLWMASKLEKQIAFAEKHDCDIVCTDGLIEQDTGQLPFMEWIAPELRPQVEHCVSPEVDTFGLLLRTNFLCASSVMLRRSLFDKLGLFDASAAPADDYDMWLRCMPDARIGFLTEPLVVYVVHSSNFSANRVLMFEKTLYALSRALKRWSDDERRAQQCEDSMRMYYRLLFDELWERRKWPTLFHHTLSLAVSRGSVGRRLVGPALRTSIANVRARSSDSGSS